MPALCSHVSANGIHDANKYPSLTEGSELAVVSWQYIRSFTETFTRNLEEPREADRYIWRGHPKEMCWCGIKGRTCEKETGG